MVFPYNLPTEDAKNEPMGLKTSIFEIYPFYMVLIRSNLQTKV